VKAGLLVLLVAGGALRLWGIGAGAPYRMGADEPVVLQTALGIVKSGDFNPHFFDYGGLFFSLHAAVSSVAFLNGAMDGRWRSLDSVWIGNLLTATRIATALIGTLTILMVFRAGLRWGPRVALVAALAMAILPPHVRESHFTLTDTPLTFLVAAALLLSLRAAEVRTYTAVAIAGFVVGLAGAVKYNGILAVVMPLVAVFALPRAARGRAAAIAVAAAIGGFLAGAPYSLFDLPAFLNAFAALMQSYNLTRPVTESASIYVGHLRNWYSWPGVLPLGLGYLGLGVILAGLAIADRRVMLPAPRLAALVLALFPLAYFAYIADHGSLIYGRYLLPIAPMLAIGFGIGGTGLARVIGRRLPSLERWALPIVLVVLVAPQIGVVVTWNREHDRPSTLDQTATWLLMHVHEGQVVAMEGAPIQVPPRLVLRRVPRLTESTIDQYRAAGIEYLVATSEISPTLGAPGAFSAGDVAASRALLDRCTRVQTFEPNAVRSGPTVAILQLPAP
jgi:4-amino-4-deoxy-L-arabinose transferase-like glycosyltransferase